MNKILIFAIIIMSNYCFSQSIGVGIGVGFSGYDVGGSTKSLEIEDIDYISKILSYFFEVEVSSDVSYVIIDASTTIKLSELKNSLYGFGRMETIRLLLIKQKAPEVSLKNIIDERRKGKALKEIAERYNLNYIEEIWLPSKEIFNEIFEVKKE